MIPGRAKKEGSPKERAECSSNLAGGNSFALLTYTAYTARKKIVATFFTATERVDSPVHASRTPEVDLLNQETSDDLSPEDVQRH